MALLPQSTDYTDKDFDSLRLRLRNLVQSVFPEWTDYNVANFGNILLEMFAHVGDVLTFYQDNQARQARITTATQRRALLGLVKLISYSPSTASAASADLTITLSASPAGSVTFPKGTFVYTQEVTSPIKYQLLADAVIPAGASPASVTVAAENSESYTQVFLTNGAANQELSLPRYPYIDDSAIVVDGSGSLVAFTQVDDFLTSGPADRHFVVVVDQNDRATVRFGNGVNGAIPIGNVTVTYKTGGGTAGRVEANKLVRLEGSWTDSFGTTVLPTVTNASASSGGTDRQSVAQIKALAPASLRAITRSVSKEDFEINARRVSGVARALMLTSNEDPSVIENTGNLYVVPVGGGTPSTTLLNDVLTMVTVTYPSTLTFSVNVQPPVYKAVNVYAVIYARQGFSKATVAASVRAALAAFFSAQNSDGTDNTNVDFGGNVKDADGNVVGEIALSDVFNVVRDTTGVRKVGAAAQDFTLNDEHDDVALTTSEFPVLGIVDLRDGDTGAVL